MAVKALSCKVKVIGACKIKGAVDLDSADSLLAVHGARGHSCAAVRSARRNMRARARLRKCKYGCGAMVWLAEGC
jgi:hypothetical protein